MMAEFALGLFVGVVMGFAICACIKVNKDDDDK